MTSTIYGLYDPSEIGPPRIRYVGYTTKDPRQRLVEHLAESNYKRTSYRHHWLRSLMLRGVRPAIIVLETVEETDDWQKRERAWIARLFCMGLVNTTDGGEGLINPSIEVRERIGRKVSVLLKGNQYRKGIPHDDASKAKMVASSKSSELVKAVKLARKGIYPVHLQTEEAKKKARTARIGMKCPWSRDIALKMAENNRGKIWINNGVRQKRHAPDATIPEGWTKGLLPSSDETRAKRNAALRRAVAQTPREEILARKDWLRGKLIWITDEITSKYHPKDDPIPEGWRRGMAFIPRKKPA